MLAEIRELSGYDAAGVARANYKEVDRRSLAALHALRPARRKKENTLEP
jgi:hypothetical protein